MREQRCAVCGRGYAEAAVGDASDEYRLSFNRDVCASCGSTLALALRGITDWLREEHTREGVLARLAERLPRRRTA